MTEVKQIDTSSASAPVGNVNQTRSESTQVILKRLTSLRHQQNKNELTKLFADQKVVAKLEQAIMYYKREDNQDQVRRAVDAEMKFANGEVVTPQMKELVMLPFMQSVSLSAGIAFEILDQYLIINYQKYLWFKSLENRMSDMQRQMQHQQSQLVGFGPQVEQPKYDRFRQELEQTASQIIAGVKAYYFGERYSLLACLLFIVNQMQHQSEFAAIFQQFFAKLRGKGLVGALISSLIRSMEADKEFKHYFDSDNDGHEDPKLGLISSLQVELISILKILFAIYYRTGSSNPPTKEECQLIMKYINESSDRHNQTLLSRLGNQQQQLINRDIIKSLGLLTALAMLQLGHGHEIITPKNNKELWDTITDPDKLTPYNSPLVLAILYTACGPPSGNNPALGPKDSKERIIYQKLSEGEREGASLVEINSLLQSEAFRADDLRPMTGAFYNVIFHWLNCAFLVFKDHRKEQEMRLVKDLAMGVLRNREIVKVIWTQIGNGENPQVFDDVLTNPMTDLHSFYQLAVALCGKKNYPYGKEKMLDYLASRQGEQDVEVGQTDLLTESISQAVELMDKFERHALSEADDAYSLFYVLKLFAKIIKQDPTQYHKLNEIHKLLEKDKERRGTKTATKLRNRSPSRSHSVSRLSIDNNDFYEQSDHPFLSLLIRALFSLFEAHDDLNPRDPIIHIMNAISSIYDTSLGMRREIMAELNRNQPDDPVSLIDKFLFMAEKEGKTFHNYKATESFLRFMCKIFKRNHPQECLEQGKNLMDSFLAHSLINYYKKCMDNWQSLQFQDAASMGSFMARLLKLTRILLDQFTEIPQSQKAPLFQPLPRFDLLLTAIVEVLNQVPIEQLCRAPLEIVSVKDHSNFGSSQLTRLENKFLHEALNSNQSSQNQCMKLAKMIAQALETLNKLVQLTLVEDTSDLQAGQQSWMADMTATGQNVNTNSSQDWSSRKLYHIQQLNCVRWMRQQMISPSRTQNVSGSQFYSTTSYSFFSQLAHYMSPSDQLDVVRSVKYQAIRLIAQVVKLWQQQPAEKPDLFNLLQELNPTQQIVQNIHRQFVGALEQGNRNLDICIAFVDLFIYATNQQQNFLENILQLSQSNKKQFERLCQAILEQIRDKNAPDNELEHQQKIQLMFKLVVLISIIAKKRICTDFVKYDKHAFAKGFLTHVIERICFKDIKKGREINFNGDYLEPYHETDRDFVHKDMAFKTKSRIVVEMCHSKVAVTYFLELLTSEFSRDPDQEVIRGLIQQIQESEGLKAISLTSAKITDEVYQLINTVVYVNNVLLNSEQERDTHGQQRHHQRIFGQDWANSSEQRDSPMCSENGRVHVQGLHCVDLFKNLQNKPRYQFMIGENNSLNSWRDAGNFGCEFFISTQELESTMKSEFYTGDRYIEQIKVLFNEFNLALSSVLADYFMLKGKHEFQVSVGRITLKENQSIVLNEFQIPSSFVPLISKDVVQPKNAQAMTQSSSRILKLMITQTEHLYKELKQRRDAYLKLVKEAAQRDAQMAPKNFLLIKLDETLLSSLIFSLGAITSQISMAPNGIPIDDAGKLDELINRDLLLKMDSIVELDSSFMSDGELMVEQAAKTRTQLQRTVEQKFEIYIQLANQCFQICSLLKEDDGQLNRQRNLAGIDKHNLETAYIKVLSAVVEGMRRNHSFEKGLQVLNIAVSLIDNDNLQDLMRKQDHQPLRVLLSRLNDAEATPTEVSEILQLLISYAQTPNGAAHLSSIRILDCLKQCSIMQRVNSEDLYTSQPSGGKVHVVRNPVHVQWCQVLLLLRTLNEELLENPTVEHQGYFDDLARLLRNFKQRFTGVLHIGVQIEGQHANRVQEPQSNQLLSLALLEEVELMCALLQQLFEHADLWRAHDDYMYQEMKDYVLFSVSKLLQHCDTRSLIPASVTEEHLKTISQSSVTGGDGAHGYHALAGADQALAEMSGLELKAELCLQNIFLTFSCSILNCLLLSKKMELRGDPPQVNQDLIDTWYEPTVWNDQHRGVNLNNSQTSVFQQNFLSQANGPVIQMALDVYQACQNRMIRRYSALKHLHDKKAIEALYNYEKTLFQHDDWIRRELQGGFYSHMLTHADGIKGALEQGEIALEVAGNVSCLLLEKVRATVAGQRFHLGGFDDTYGSTRDIQGAAKKLEEALKETDGLVKENALQGESSSDNILPNQGRGGSKPQRADGGHMKGMLAFSNAVQARPGLD